MSVHDDAPGDAFRISSISVNSNNVSLVLGRSEDVSDETKYFELCATTNLAVPRCWQSIAYCTFPVGTTNMPITLSRGLLGGYGISNLCCFTFIESGDDDGDGLDNWYERFVTWTSPNDVDTDQDGLDDGLEVSIGTSPIEHDTDGDGLSDQEEAGCVNVMPEFEWYDTSGLSTEYGVPPPSGITGYSGASAIYYFDEPVYIWGLPCTYLIAFDTGCLSLVTPYDLMWWVFPQTCYPLDINYYNTGSFWVAPYWRFGHAKYGDTNSFIRVGRPSGSDVTVVEYRNIRESIFTEPSATYQVIIPDGNSNVVRVSYLRSDYPLDGSDTVVGIQNSRVWNSTDGCYNLTWNFQERGPIVPPVTVQYVFGEATDPLKADTDGDGLDDGYELDVSLTDPLYPDCDGDGLDDGAEMSLGTDPWSRDTDGDGLSDKWEVDNQIDPVDANGIHGASGDYDGDGLTNLQEQELGTDPRERDSDHDGLDDADELAAGTDPLNPDTDGDGLSDGCEVNSVLTNPLVADTDGDGLPDGWEDDYGLDPLSTNGVYGAEGDFDMDGLGNWQEYALGTDPGNGHTFDPVVGDSAWVANGFCAFPPADAVSVTASVGDSSGSESERWMMLLVDSSDGGRMFALASDSYGRVATTSFGLERGRTYVGSLVHLGTVPTADDPDYDWEAHMDDMPSSTVLASGAKHDILNRLLVLHSKNVMIDNEDGLLGNCDPYFDDVDNTIGKTFTLTAVKTSIEGGDRIVPVSCRDNAELSLSADSTQEADWTIEPLLEGGARILATDGEGLGAAEVSGAAKVYVSAGWVPTNYVIRARHPICTNSADSVSFTVCQVSVKNVRFNHDTSSSASDGINMRSDYSTPGFDFAKGEWAENGDVCFPICYKAGVQPTVQAKFDIEPADISSAQVFAQQIRPGSPLGGLVDREVAFTNGQSDWVTFTGVSSIPSSVALSSVEFEWYVRGLGGETVTLTSCGRTGPNRVYVVLDDPVEPWSSSIASNQCAWTNALEFACGWATGSTTKESVASNMTRTLFYGMGYTYDTINGKSHYCAIVPDVSDSKGWRISSFDLSGYIVSRSALVNCYDQAFGLSIMNALIGCHLKVYFTSPFGYINSANLVGVGLCNNPFYGDPRSLRCGMHICNSDDVLRSRFGNHMYATWFESVFDACVGPHLGSMTQSDYLYNMIDTSTEYERQRSYFSSDNIEAINKEENIHVRLE